MCCPWHHNSFCIIVSCNSAMFKLLCKWRQWKRLNGKRSFWSTSRPEQISAWSSHPNLASAAPHHPLAAKTNMWGWVFYQIEQIVMKNMPVKSLGLFIIGEKYLWDRWETAVTWAGCKLLQDWLAWYWSCFVSALHHQRHVFGFLAWLEESFPPCSVAADSNGLEWTGQAEILCQL